MKKLSLLALILFATTLVYSQASDDALKSVIAKDRASRSTDGKLVTLPAGEHLARGTVYFDNRSFVQAREHFQKIIDNYPNDLTVSSALWMTGRSYYWERDYKKCIPMLARANSEFPESKNGRESLYFQASCNVRMGQNAEAAKLFEKYIVMYPGGERIDGAFLNEIDSLRESNQFDAANQWVDRVREKFKGTHTETNALHGRLRMQIYRGLWADAVATAALMESQAKIAGSMTSLDEIRYLRAYSLDKQGKKAEALAIYGTISRKPTSYYGGLAADKLKMSVDMSAIKASEYPAPFRVEVLQYAKQHKLDPRYVLAIMKQESSFRSEVKSPSAARGLLQLVMDTALKYNKKAGFAGLQPDDLYVPRTNIAIGTEYLADLRGQFNGMLEAVAASYNGGEDNAARWLNRSKPKDSAIFTSEVGFPETKNYVFKVMTNYRIYQGLYDENLVRK